MPVIDESYRFDIQIRYIPAIIERLVPKPQPGSSEQVMNKYYDDLDKKYKDVSDHHTHPNPTYLTLADVELQGNDWELYGEDTFSRMAWLRREVTATVAGFPLTYKDGDVVYLKYTANEPSGTVSFGEPREIVISGQNASSRRTTRRLGRRNRRNRRRNTRRSTRKN